MTSDYFKFDYDLESLKRIKIHGFQMWVTPRYLPHYKDNGYEPFSTEIVNNYLKDDSTFMDVGAHYGYYSILASKAKKNVEVISIEPVKENFQILEKNLKLNKVEKTSIYNVALSNKDGVKRFNVTEASDSAGFYNHPLTQNKKSLDVKTRSLDSLIKNKKIDFIKIDVEGHEIFVLSGMKKTIANNKKLKMLIEFNPKILKNAGFKPQDLINKIENFGFEVFLLNENSRKYYRLTNNHYSWNEIISDSNYDSFYANLFCVKKEEALLTTFFSHSSGLEGAERSLLEVLKNLPDYGALSHLICPSQGLLINELKGKAIATDIIPLSWWASVGEEQTELNTYATLLSIGGFLKELEKINPHVIFTNTSVIPWGALSAAFLSKPHLWFVHEFGDLDHNLSFLTSISEARLIIDKMSDQIIFNSQAVEKHYFESKNKKSKVIYFGINIGKSFDDKVERIFKKSNSLKIVLVGSVRESKGQDQAINAVADLTKKGFEIELLLLGKYDANDIYYKKLKSLVKKNKLKNVYFKNFVINPYPYIDQADVLLMCSRAEAFGRVTVEGMLLKKVVIGSRSGATPEIIQDKKTGLLYKQGNIGDLTKKIEYLINNSQKMKEIAENGYREATEKFNTNKYIKSIYNSLISLKKIKIKTLPNTRVLIKNVLQEINRDKTELGLRIENQEKIIKQFISEKENQEKIIKQLISEKENISHTLTETNEIIENIKSAKFFKLWQTYCQYRDNMFRKS